MSGSLRVDAPRFDLAVAGHANIDRFLYTDRLPQPDRTVPLERTAQALGGTAATLARVASSAGVRVALISRVGEDFPAEFRATLRREGVSLAGVEQVPQTRSPTCYVIEDAHGGQMTLIHQGPMGDARGAAVPIELLAQADWLHLSTGDPAFQLALKSAARERGVRVAVDPAQEVHYLWDARRLRELLDGAEILFGNRAEIARVLQLLRRPRLDSLLAIVPLIVQTEGPAGSTAFARTGAVHAPAAGRLARGSVTGAGDAFRGGFYGAFFRGEPVLAALRAGNRAAAEWMRTGTRRRSVSE